jgi:hypothetical protein
MLEATSAASDEFHYHASGFQHYQTCGTHTATIACFCPIMHPRQPNSVRWLGAIDVRLSQVGIPVFETVKFNLDLRPRGTFLYEFSTSPPLSNRSPFLFPRNHRFAYRLVSAASKSLFRQALCFQNLLKRPGAPSPVILRLMPKDPFRTVAASHALSVACTLFVTVFSSPVLYFQQLTHSFRKYRGCTTPYVCSWVGQRHRWGSRCNEE